MRFIRSEMTDRRRAHGGYVRKRAIGLQHLLTKLVCEVFTAECSDGTVAGRPNPTDCASHHRYRHWIAGVLSYFTCIAAPDCCRGHPDCKRAAVVGIWKTRYSSPRSRGWQIERWFAMRFFYFLVFCLLALTGVLWMSRPVALGDPGGVFAAI